VPVPACADADADGDDVPNAEVACPNTPAEAIVNADGCPIEQLCPCDAPWKHHIHYGLCVTKRTVHFVKEGLISKRDGVRILAEAVRSSCGNTQ
jgi:hypothetical protein